MKSLNVEIKITPELSNDNGWNKLQCFIQEFKETRLTKPQIKILKEAKLYLYQSSFALPNNKITEEIMIKKLTYRPLVGRLIS